MLTKVEFTTPQGALLSLNLEEPDGYFIMDIDGLDPVKANIVSSSFANEDGVQHHSSRRDERNPVFKLKLEPDYSQETARQLRNRLYEFFMPKAIVHMRYFMDDGLTVDIDGKVEDFKCPMFVKEPVATISLLCEDPDFYVPTPVVVGGDTTELDTEFVIDYDGTSETGFKFTLNVDRSVNGFAIYHRTSGDDQTILEFDSALVADDILEISTVDGSKSVMKTDISGTASVMYGMSPYSPWLKLYPGLNYLRVHATGAAIPFTIDYTTKYGGL